MIALQGHLLLERERTAQPAVGGRTRGAARPSNWVASREFSPYVRIRQPDGSSQDFALARRDQRYRFPQDPGQSRRQYERVNGIRRTTEDRARRWPRPRAAPGLRLHIALELVVDVDRPGRDDGVGREGRVEQVGIGADGRARAERGRGRRPRRRRSRRRRRSWP